MSIFDKILENLPEVANPTQKRLSFKEKLKWTLIVLISFFVLGLVPLFGLGQNALQQFQYLSIILGAKFGSIISLGIGPLVTASIVLQLLNGSGIVKFDLTTVEGKAKFQAVQKLLSYGFILFEATIYVFMGGLAPPAELAGTSLYSTLQVLLIIQLFIGGILIMFMDELVSKWGFGSGISLFIAAGVSEQIFIKAFSWLHPPSNPDAYVGAIPELFRALSAGDPTSAGIALAGVVSTIIVILISVYTSSMKVEIPLSFGKARGYGVRWPLAFFYTSNIPVILIAALLANIQLWARLLMNWGHPWLGTFSPSGAPASGLVLWIQPVNILGNIISHNLVLSDILHSAVYVLIMVIGSVIFSIFWVQTSGMDAKSQAENIMATGLQIPGFRNDKRILERILNRYIQPLTVMGGMAVGFLAAFADLFGALSRGTGILLAVMIIYQLYEEIAKEHMMDMNPMARKFFE